MLDINYLAALAAGLAYFIMGGLWFARFTFGRVYESTLGFQRPDDWKETPIYYFGPLAGSLVASIALAYLMALIGPTSALASLQIGLIAGLGIAGPVCITISINPKIEKPIAYGLLTGSYHAAGLGVAALIIYGIG